MILFLYGEDTYRSKKKLDDIRAKFLKDLDASGLNLNEIDGERAEIDEIRSALMSSPFLAPKRLVLVKDAIASCGKKDAEALAEVLDRVPDETILVLYERVGSESLEGKPAYEKLKGGKFYPEFRPLTPKELKDWIQREAKERGIAFAKDALETYLPLAGVDAWKISGELDVMAATARAAGRSVVDKETVRASSHLRTEESVFDLLDAIGTRRADAAAAKMDALLEQGETEVGLLVRIQGHVRGLLIASELASLGQATKDRLVREIGAHPFVAAKLLSQSRYYRLPELERLYVWLVDADEKLKRGGWPNPRMALDLFMAEIAKEPATA